MCDWITEGRRIADGPPASRAPSSSRLCTPHARTASPYQRIGRHVGSRSGSPGKNATSSRPPHPSAARPLSEFVRRAAPCEAERTLAGLTRYVLDDEAAQRSTSRWSSPPPTPNEGCAASWHKRRRPDGATGFSRRILCRYIKTKAFRCYFIETWRRFDTHIRGPSPMRLSSWGRRSARLVLSGAGQCAS
jgi:hypothetical protein